MRKEATVRGAPRLYEILIIISQINDWTWPIEIVVIVWQFSLRALTEAEGEKTVPGSGHGSGSGHGPSKQQCQRHRIMRLGFVCSLLIAFRVQWESSDCACLPSPWTSLWPSPAELADKLSPDWNWNAFRFHSGAASVKRTWPPKT